MESSKLKVDVIIPAFNESLSIGKVVEDLPKDLVREVIVVNNNSTDTTEIIALKAGATVLKESRKGYGYACLKGMDYLANKPSEDQPDIILFIDGDYSDYPEEAWELVKPIIQNEYDMVIGSRVLGKMEKGAMLPQQIFGNWLATTLIKSIYNIKFTDLGPFRAIRYNKLLTLNMQDQTYGWTVEMQVKAARQGLKCAEVPVRYRKRIGKSKVTGTVKGTLMAGYKILYTIFKYS